MLHRINHCTETQQQQINNNVDSVCSPSYQAGSIYTISNKLMFSCLFIPVIVPVPICLFTSEKTVWNT